MHAHFAEPDHHQRTRLMQAQRHAIEAADIDPQSIDLIIVATSTPDYRFP
jgi:3-oxoacyl-[acyl-carrier-protein] synthase-3